MNQEKRDPSEVATSHIKIEPVEAPGGIFHTYANHVLANWTPYDVRIRFGEGYRLPELTPEQRPTMRIEERVSVTLSWTEAKVLRDILTDVIEKFEKLNGKITTPKIP
jgi:hypothetical protein